MKVSHSDVCEPWTSLSETAMVMLMKILCWWLYDGDRFKMFVTHYVGEFLSVSVTNISNRSRISQSYHQHILSPTSVTNINIASETTTEGTLPNRFYPEPSYPEPIWFGTTEMLLKFQGENKFYRFVCFYFYLDINQLSCIETLFIFWKLSWNKTI